MVNKKLGNQYENILLKELKKKGCWCHLFSYNKNGQPCDIVAIKYDTSFLIDVKHCDEIRFSFDKIQPNQITCFEYAKVCGCKNTGFAIWFSCKSKWYWLPYTMVVKFKDLGYKSVGYEALEELDL